MGRGRLGNLWQTLVEVTVFQILLLISLLLPLSHVAHSVIFFLKTIKVISSFLAVLSLWCCAGFL